MCFHQLVACIIASVTHTWFFLCGYILEFLGKADLIVSFKDSDNKR